MKDQNNPPTYITKNSQGKLYFRQIKIIDCTHSISRNNFPSYEQASMPAHMRIKLTKSLQPEKLKTLCGYDAQQIKFISHKMCDKRICPLDPLGSSGCKQFDDYIWLPRPDNNPTAYCSTGILAITIATCILYLTIKPIQWIASGLIHLVAACMNRADQKNTKNIALEYSILNQKDLKKLDAEVKLKLRNSLDKDRIYSEVFISINPLNPLPKELYEDQIISNKAIVALQSSDTKFLHEPVYTEVLG